MRAAAIWVGMLVVSLAPPATPPEASPDERAGDPATPHVVRTPSGERLVGRVVRDSAGRRWIETAGTVSQVRRPLPPGAIVQPAPRGDRRVATPARSPLAPSDAQLAWWLLFGGALED